MIISCYTPSDDSADVKDRCLKCHCMRNTSSAKPREMGESTIEGNEEAVEWCHRRGNWTSAEWNQVVFSDESRLNLSSDDNRVRVWRPRGERLNPAFALQ
ncbi:transposable element Tcb2 transposase [Trichonephila clavipes]|nr:transposable element Tcb2 transposase [Trichonephila clavipes]